MPRVFCSKHVFFFEQFLDGCSCQVDPFQSWIIIGFPAKEGWRSIYVYIYIRLKNMSTDNFCGEVVINFGQT